MQKRITLLIVISTLVGAVNAMKAGIDPVKKEDLARKTFICTAVRVDSAKSKEFPNTMALVAAMKKTKKVFVFTTETRGILTNQQENSLKEDLFEWKIEGKTIRFNPDKYDGDTIYEIWKTAKGYAMKEDAIIMEMEELK